LNYAILDSYYLVYLRYAILHDILSEITNVKVFWSSFEETQHIL